MDNDNFNFNDVYNDDTQPIKYTFCRQCGQRLLSDATHCAFCGMPVSYGNFSAESVPRAPKKVKKQGLLPGILSVLFFFFPVVAVILGIVAVQLGAKTKNKVAVILGVIGIIATVVFFTVTVIMIASTPTQPPTTWY